MDKEIVGPTYNTYHEQELENLFVSFCVWDKMPLLHILAILIINPSFLEDCGLYRYPGLVGFRKLCKNHFTVLPNSNIRK